MNRQLVWDLPVRLFHGLLALTFVGAFTIANVVDDDSALFSAHMLLGLVMTFMVALRIIWGLVGTKHARFADFAYGPKSVWAYLRDVFRGKPTHHAGHNPGSSVAIFLMLLFVLGLGVTGVLMASGNDALEDVHGVLSWALLVTVVGHIAGIILHTVKQRDNITLTMIDGHKAVAPSEGIKSARPIVGLVFLVLVALLGWRLVAGFDPVTRTLTVPLIGGTLQLGEVDNGSQEGGIETPDDD